MILRKFVIWRKFVFLRKFVILMKFVFLRKFVILRKFVFLMSKVNRVGEAGEENIQTSGWDTPTGSRTDS